MPIYEYRCEDGHTFEVFQSMSDAPVAECEECGAPVERVFHPVAVHFKGPGFYNTDYKKTGATAESKGGNGDSESSSDSSSSGDSNPKDSGGPGGPGGKDSGSPAKSGSGSD